MIPGRTNREDAVRLTAPHGPDIHAIMAAQSDRVQIVARFDPRIVKMAPAGERPEDYGGSQNKVADLVERLDLKTL